MKLKLLARETLHSTSNLLRDHSQQLNNTTNRHLAETQLRLLSSDAMLQRRGFKHKKACEIKSFLAAMRNGRSHV